jgi:hypothetical protein
MHMMRFISVRLPTRARAVAARIKHPHCCKSTARRAE